MWKALAAAVNKMIDSAGERPSVPAARAATTPQAPAVNQRWIDQSFERAVTLLHADNKPGADAAMQEVVDRAASFNSAGLVYADALFKHALILSAAGEPDRAAERCRQAVAVPATDEVARKARLNYQLNLGDMLTRLRRLDEAEVVLRESLSGRRLAYGERHAGYAAGLSAIADLELARGRYAEALAAVDEALTIVSAAAPERAPAELALRAYAVTAGGGADPLRGWEGLAPEGKNALVRSALQRSSQAEPRIAQAVLVELRDRLTADEGDAGLKLSVYIAISHVAQRTGDHETRIAAAREAVRLCQDRPERSALAAAQRNLAQALADAGRNDEVPAVYAAAVDAARETGQLPLLSDILRTYALWADTAGRPEVAEPLYAEAAQHGASSGAWATHGRSSTAFGVFLQHQARPDQARRWLEEAIAHLPPNHSDIVIARQHLDALNRGVPCGCAGGRVMPATSPDLRDPDFGA